jgi:hypothetical protein
MRIALAILCLGGVSFLLHVLAAFVKEGTRLPPGPVRVHFAKFSPARRRGELIEMSLEPQKESASAEVDEWSPDFGNPRSRTG